MNRKKFNKIVILDPAGLTFPEIDQIRSLSAQALIEYDSVPGNDCEIVERVGDADAVLVSWRTHLNRDVISRFPKVKYIGMCCSLYDELSANVDISAARAAGITVLGVRDYGDEGTVEFVFGQLIALFKGFSHRQWRPELQELKGKSIGVVGMGTLGRMVAATALHFGMNVFYNSRSEKDDLRNTPIQYLPLEKLVAECDVVTTHLPKGTIVLDHTILAHKKENSILINTSLGPTFEKDALLSWLDRDPGSYAIFDQEGAGTLLDVFSLVPNIVVYSKSSGSTFEAKKRLSQKVYDNLVGYLG